MQQPTELVLPDLFSLCPFPWIGSNPHYSPSNRETTEWMLSFGIFTNETRARLDATLPELAGAYAYPYADAKGLRIASDFLMILFALDEITDVQDAHEARATRETFIKALTGKSGDDNSAVTRFTKDFVNRMSGVSDAVRERFVTHCINYMDATINEARLRGKDEVLSVEECIRHRRDTGGVRACFDLIEVVLGITLPAEVLEDPNFIRASDAANDMVCWSNDIYSFPMEYARGIEASNAVTVVMQNKGLPLQEAVDHVAEQFKDFGETIASCKANICSFGPEINKAIRSYIYGLEQWTYGNLAWSFDTKRYFGAEHEEVKRTRIVKLQERNSMA